MAAQSARHTPHPMPKTAQSRRRGCDITADLGRVDVHATGDNVTRSQRTGSVIVEIADIADDDQYAEFDGTTIAITLVVVKSGM